MVQAGVRCGMDLSDGLTGDLRRICAASGVAANIDVQSLPIDPLLRQQFGERALSLALSGGEDYELLCAGPAKVLSQAQEMLNAVVGSPLTAIGSVVEADPSRPAVLLADGEGRLNPPPRSGWEHFSAGRDEDRT